MTIKRKALSQALLIQQANRRYAWLGWQVLQKLTGQYGVSKSALMGYLLSLQHCHSKTTAEYVLRYLSRFQLIATRNQGKRAALYYLTTHGASLLVSYTKLAPQEPDSISPEEEIL